MFILRRLEIGIYSSPGPNACAAYEGTDGYEEQDAKTWAAWGIDSLKCDRCPACNLYTDEEMQAVYRKMGDALRAAGRPISYSACANTGAPNCGNGARPSGGNLWPTTGDIHDTCASMTNIGFRQDELAPWAEIGHFNDPAMLEIGNGGMNGDEHRTHMSLMSLWSPVAALVLAGNDLRDVPPDILAILTNREAIAVDRDKTGKQGGRAWQSGEQEIWARELAAGGRAVAISNRAAGPVNVNRAALEMAPPARVGELWTHRNERAGINEYGPGSIRR
jgi:alpha-galactosidase